MSEAQSLFRPKEYLKPGSIQEAAILLAKYAEKGSTVAGGTDVMAMKNPRTEVLIDVSGLGLSYIKPSTEGLLIGATTTLETIEKSSVINSGAYAILAQAAHKVGTPLIRNMGTLGGNLCNASPSADTPAALLALGAKLKLVSSSKTREIPVEEFFTGPFRCVKRSDELLTEILLPALAPRSGTAYQWLTKNNVIDESLVAMAALIVLDGTGAKTTVKNARFGLISVAPTPIRAKKAEAMLIGKAINDELIAEVAKMVAGETKPRSRAQYRKEMSATLAEQTIREAIAQAKSAKA